MTSITILLLGTFWEASMDTLGSKRNFYSSQWFRWAQYFDKKGLSWFGLSFWDHSTAWKNKWKQGDPKNGERFPGSSTSFVTLMDGWHLVKFLWLMHLFAAFYFYETISGYLLLDMLIMYFVFGIGHEVFWKLLNRPAEVKITANSKV